MAPHITYPESLFTTLRLDLMLMRFKLMDAENHRSGLVPQDMADIFSDLCSLDKRIIAAQKRRGYSDKTTLRVLNEVAAERKARRPLVGV